MRTDVRPLFEVDETVHLQVSLGFVHFRAGLALERAHAYVILAMAQQLRFAHEAARWIEQEKDKGYLRFEEQTFVVYVFT